MNKHMKDDNWMSSRQSILKKYDKDGNGHFDTEEVNAIVDDYMVTMKNNASLVDSHEGQRKILIFSACLILLLSISNLGTAFLAVNLAKEVRVSSDGTMTTADSNKNLKKTVKTLSIADRFSVKGLAAQRNSTNDDRRLADDESTDDVNVACFTEDEVLRMYNNALEGSGTSLIIDDEEVEGIQAAFFIGGVVQRNLMAYQEYDNRNLADGEEIIPNYLYSFPDSGFKFLAAPNGCGAENRRNLFGGTVASRIGQQYVGRLSSSSVKAKLLPPPYNE